MKDTVGGIRSVVASSAARRIRRGKVKMGRGRNKVPDEVSPSAPPSRASVTTGGDVLSLSTSPFLWA